MRSVIHLADTTGIAAIVDQQFAVARQILATGLMPILEPEISIDSPDKAAAEALLKSAILESLAGLPKDSSVMLKLTLPEVDDFYLELLDHPNVLRLLALSGGYSREVADARLSKNHGTIASFSRALMDGLRRGQTEAEFDRTLADSIQNIYAASLT
jgi:fructose-bisphosphate aldolase, class I